MKIAVLALLATSAQAITLWSVTGERMYSELEETDGSLIQLQAGGDLTDKPTEYFLAGEHGQLGAREYERVVPARFSADSDDIFMRSMIQNYAMEEKTDDGVPSARFWMNESIKIMHGQSQRIQTFTRVEGAKPAGAGAGLSSVAY